MQAVDHRDQCRDRPFVSRRGLGAERSILGAVLLIAGLILSPALLRAAVLIRGDHHAPLVAELASNELGLDLAGLDLPADGQWRDAEATGRLRMVSSA
jgi:hypothetical protein